MIALMKEAVALANVNGVEQLPEEDPGIQAAVPEHSSPGESSSNGASERAVQAIEDHCRVLKLALEHRLGLKVSCHLKIMDWMVEHAAMLLTKCHASGHDNRTGFERYHGKDCNERLPGFAETLLYFVPKRLRHKLDAR